LIKFLGRVFRPTTNLLIIASLLAGYTRDRIQYHRSPLSEGLSYFFINWLTHLAAVFFVIVIVLFLAESFRGYLFPGMKEPFSNDERDSLRYSLLTNIVLLTIIGSCLFILFIGIGGFSSTES
jgi:amino acid transporter